MKRSWTISKQVFEKRQHWPSNHWVRNFYSIFSINIYVCLNSLKESVSISFFIFRNKQQVCHIEIIRMRTGSNTSTGIVLKIFFRAFCFVNFLSFLPSVHFACIYCLKDDRCKKKKTFICFHCLPAASYMNW
jgi:hypothetical protein